LRSIGVFLSTFINAELDSDGRMRCSFSIAGPTTFRFSSSENAFGSGMNLQNIPVAAKEKVKGGEYVKLPNVRKLFIPDPGYTFYDMDLDRADMQVVAAEAQLTGDNALRAILDKGLDLHCISAAEIFNIKGIPPDELYEAHPNYKEHRAKITEANRNKTKNGGHATNYGVGDYKLAQTLGITVQEAGDFRARWFGVFPGIKHWHLRTEENATKRGFVENRFGARLNVLGRFDLPECLAWVPQSTVAGVINRAFLAIDAAEQRGEISNQVLIQVHDSLAGQFLTEKTDRELEAMRQLARVAVPYEKELIIPVGINISKISWGHCKA
jgi:DNA polymerase-1